VKTKIDGSEWNAYGSRGSGLGQFNSPSGIYYDTLTEYIYVADSGNNRIVQTSIAYTPFTIPVAREIARISGFSNPVAVSVNPDPDFGDCWVADGSNTVVWINGDIGGVNIPETAGYDINNPADSDYHKIITGFDNPVSVAVDPLSGDCWVACQGEPGADSYIVKLNSDVPNGYDIDNPSSSKHIRIYGFNSPQSVSVDPTTGECWVADKDQIVKLSPEGHAYSGYTVAADYPKGDTEIGLIPDEGVSSDTSIFIPLKVSFDENHNLNEIKYVYEIEGIESDTLILKTGLEKGVSSGAPLYQELVRVGGFASPSDVSAFKGPDLGELGLHPWNLQIRELYVVNEDKFEEDEWHGFPAMAPVHDATPQFRWQYLDVDGTYSPLQSYKIRLYTRDNNGNFVNVWDSEERTVQPGIDIMPGQWIYTDWDKVASTTKENDSTSIYSAYHYLPYVPDDDDCLDLSQDDNDSSDTGDRTYFVQLTVTNANTTETYPEDIQEAIDSDSPITFILDKTPPGSYRVCGTQVLLPATDNDNIKENHGDMSTTTYYQTDNYYWDEVWVEWDGGNTEIVREDSPWIDKKEVTVRVKVKDKNNENDGHPGHGLTEWPERDTDCSGISLDAQYRYSLASSPSPDSIPPAPRIWSDWKNCSEVKLFDNDAHDSEGVTLNMGGEKNTFVWLYAKNVKFENGDTNLIQFRVKDEGELEVPREDTKYVDVNGDTQEIWIAPNIGYSHADTAKVEIVSGYPVKFQVASNEFGYPIQIDTDIPQVILIEYPPNPYPHQFASFRWVAIDTTKCWFKYKLEYWNEAAEVWTRDVPNDGKAFNGEDPFTYSANTDDWSDTGTDETITNFDGLQVGRWYRFWVKAKDQNGAECDGLGQSPCSRRVSDDVIWVWYVSPEVPDTIITYGPSGQTIDNSPTFRWRGIDGTPPYKYKCRIDGQDWTSDWDTANDSDSIDNNEDFDNLSEGSHILQVQARDSNGGVDPTPARRIFTVVNPNKPPYSPISPKNLYKYFREMVE
ncbi:MAG: hypothetical protein V1709_02670, partial [Planctomycetota bacterium]